MDRCSIQGGVVPWYLSTIMPSRKRIVYQSSKYIKPPGSVIQDVDIHSSVFKMSQRQSSDGHALRRDRVQFA